MKNEIQKFINTPNVPKEDCDYIEWIYLPSGISGKTFTSDVPDFKGCNTTMISLANEDKMHELVEKSISVIENNLLSLLI